MKLTNNLTETRVYLDANSTVPLASSVREWLGDCCVYGNPASQHRSGQQSKALINQTKGFLFDFFGLSPDIFDLFFHSGASESIETLYRHVLHQKGLIYYHPLDHVVWENLANRFGHAKTYELSLGQEGQIEDLSFSNAPAPGDWVNCTWMNNELGYLLSLDQMRKYVGSEVMIHVDATQAPGRVDGFWQLNPSLDMYSFSGHKFGALKGVGFSFVKKSVELTSLVTGARQQLLRGGTENVHGIYSLQLALTELKEKFSATKMGEYRQQFVKVVEDQLQGMGELLSEQFAEKSLNTLYFYFYNIRADKVVSLFDIEGLEVSRGSACSSGSTLDSRILTALDIASDQRKNGIRLSFDYRLSHTQKDFALIKLRDCLQRLRDRFES